MKEKAGAESGLYLQPGGTGSWQSFMPFAWSNGAELTKDEQFTLDSPEMSEALQYYGSFFKDKLSTTTDLGLQGSLEQSFITGKIGAFISGPWHVGLLAEQGGAGFTDKFAVAPMPTKKSATSFIGGSNLAVFKDAKNRDGAWKFVQWLSKPDVQVKWYQAVKRPARGAEELGGPDARPATSSSRRSASSSSPPRRRPRSPRGSRSPRRSTPRSNGSRRAARTAAAATKAMQEKASSIGTGG